jgi:hypothetical protein
MRIATHRRGRTALLLTLLIAALMSGCLSEPEVGPPVDTVQVTIEFKGYQPDTHPGKMATWTPEGEGRWGINLVEAGDNGTIYVVLQLNASTVLDALLAAAEASDIIVEHHQESMGAFVDSIDGVENGRDGHFWSYYLDGEYGTVAADRAALESGAIVRWVYLGNPVG